MFQYALSAPLPPHYQAYDCIAVYIAGRHTSLVVYGWWPQPPTKKHTYSPIIVRRAGLLWSQQDFESR